MESSLSRRTCLLIIGTHRSGTSLLARVLATLGCELPATLMGGGYGNEDGHWESTPIAAFNDQLFAAFGSTWDACFPLPERWEFSPIYAKYFDQAGQLIDSEFENSALFVLKDPRICRLASFWRKVLESRNIEVATIFPLRPPQQVVGSLEYRDETPVWYGQLMWLRNMLDAEIGSRGVTRVFSNFEDLCRDWRTQIKAICAPFDIVLPRFSEIAASEIDLYIRQPGNIATVAVPLPVFASADNVLSWMSKITAILSDWSVRGENHDDYSELDRIRLQFDSFVQTLGGLLNPDKNAGAFGQGVRKREELQWKLSAMENEVLMLKTELDQARANPDSDLARRDLEQQLAVRLEEIEQVRTDLTAKEAALAARAAEVAQLAERNHEIEATSQAVQADLTGQISARFVEIEQVRTDLTAKEAALAAAEAALAERAAEVAQLDGRIVEIEQSGKALEAELARYEVDMERLVHELADANAKAGFSQSHLRQREEEIDQYRREIADMSAELADYGRVRERLVESEAWVFQLAGERAADAMRIKKLEASAKLLSDKIVELTDQLKRQTEEYQQIKLADQARQNQLLEDLTGAQHPAQPDSGADSSARLVIEEQLDKLLEDVQRESARAERAEQAEIALRDQLAQRFDETAQLTREIRDKEQALASLRDSLQRERERAENAERAELRLRDELSQRYGETAQLSRLILEKDQQLDKTDWLRQIHVRLARRPTWWFLLPAKWRVAKERRMLKRAELFDAEGYLTRYPDVAQDGMDPLIHYIVHGSTEGRTPFL